MLFPRQILTWVVICSGGDANRHEALLHVDVIALRKGSTTLRDSFRAHPGEKF